MNNVLIEKQTIISLRDTLETGMKEAMTSYKRYSMMRNEEERRNIKDRYNLVIQKELSKYRAYKFCYTYMKDAFTYSDVDKVIESIRGNIRFLENNIEKLKYKINNGGGLAIELKKLLDKIYFYKLEIQSYNYIIDMISEKIEMSKNIDNGVKL